MAEEFINNNPEDAATLSNGNDIIDATQNAIIDAAEYVSEVFDKANPDIAHQIADVPFYADVEFWVGMAFILAIVLLAKPAYKFFKEAMHNKIDSVKNQIDEAVKLRDDAQDLLAEYERKFSTTDDEVAKIRALAEKNIANQKKNDLAALKENTAVKEKEIKRRIASSTESAMAEINQSVATSVIELARNAILKHINKANKSSFIDNAINNLDKFIK